MREREEIHMDNGINQSNGQGMSTNQMQGMSMNQTQGMPMNQAQGMSMNQTQGMPMNQTQGMPINQMQGMPMNQTQGMPMNQMQGMPMNQMQGMPMNQMQGMPMNQQNMPKKRNTGCIIGLFAGILLILGIIMLIMLFVLVGKNEEEKTYTEYYESDEDYDNEDDYEDDYEDEDDMSSGRNSDRKKESESLEEEPSVAKKETQRIGNASLGYLDIPADFVLNTKESDLNDFEGIEIMQYSDEAGVNVITLERCEDLDAKTLADSSVDYVKSISGVDMDSIAGYKVTIGGYDAYQIYATFPDENIMLVIWCFETPDVDKDAHYLAIEFGIEYPELWKCSESFSMTR